MKSIISISFLLLVFGANSQENKSVHLKFESDSSSNFILYQGFVVRYNNEKKVPSFTIHQLSPNQINPNKGDKVKRASSFKIESRINYKYQSRSKDYTKSGYDRGHMVPAGDFYWNKPLKDETFVYSNVSPQNPTFNRQLFRKLETAIREKVIYYNSPAYIIAGVLYPESYKRFIGNQVGVPAAIYKIIYFPEQEKMYAYLIDNSISFYSMKLKHFVVSTNDLERLTGENFFDLIPLEKQNSLESMIQTL